MVLILNDGIDDDGSLLVEGELALVLLLVFPRREDDLLSGLGDEVLSGRPRPQLGPVELVLKSGEVSWATQALSDSLFFKCQCPL